MNNWLGRNKIGMLVLVVLGGMLTFIVSTGWSVPRKGRVPVGQSAGIDPPLDQRPYSMGTTPASPPPPQIVSPPTESAPQPRPVGDWLSDFERDRER